MIAKPKELKKIVGDVCRDKNDLLARKVINEEFRERLVHFVKHRDVRGLNDVLSKFNDPILKTQILHHVTERLPFSLNETKEAIVIDKERIRGLTVQLINIFNLMDGAIQKKSPKGVMRIDCDQDISTDELVSWLADTLTLRRREFSDSHVDYLIDLLNMIKGRNTDKIQMQGKS